MSKRLIIISNRLPINVSKRKDTFIYSRSSGGLVTGMSSFYKTYESLWIGWPGYTTGEQTEKEKIEQKLYEEKMVPVFLSRREIEQYYEGFSNNTIWPLFHYFMQHTEYDNKQWDAYEKVNHRFAEIIAKIARPDDIFWIQDYHLMLLPHLVRESFPESSIGFFLHIPFPSYEIFRTLPWRQQILKGLMGSDLIGFHTFDYVRHFLSTTTRLLGLEPTLARFNYEDRIVQVDSFPMGIDYDKFRQAGRSKEVINEVDRYRQKLSDCRFMLSIDRLDYSKGILQRLKGFQLFLHQHPEFQEKISFIMVVVPSRSRVKTYRELKYQLDEWIGRINGEFDTIGWTPILYFYRSIPFTSLVALYNLAEVALITPFRDGMNLVAKEYVASKSTENGVLILSEMAGSADEMGEALLINPNNIENIAEAIYQAFTMPEEERHKRFAEMRQKLSRYHIKRWAEDFLLSLLHTKEKTAQIASKSIIPAVQAKLLSHFKRSKNRIIILDYDGTLVPFASTPELAKPDEDLMHLLKKIVQIPGCDVVINSGRDKNTLDQWLEGLQIGIAAEHGAWIKIKGGNWETIEPLQHDWKLEIRGILENAVERTPGAFIEEKDFSLVWHYRKADVGLGQLRARELMSHLLYVTGNLNLQVLEGNKVVEVKNAGVNKGRAAMKYLELKSYEFILVFGDDWTDEYLFKALPKEAYTIKVGLGPTVAEYSLKSFRQVRNILKELVEKVR